MPEPAPTSNNRLMFSTEEWGMVSKTQIEHATVFGDLNEDTGVLVVWTRGTASNPDTGWTARQRHLRRRIARCTGCGRPDTWGLNWFVGCLLARVAPFRRSAGGLVWLRVLGVQECRSYGPKRFAILRPRFPRADRR